MASQVIAVFAAFGVPAAFDIDAWDLPELMREEVPLRFIQRLI